jgi:hypothetical protein
MYELNKIGKVFTSKFVGTWPSSYKKNLPAGIGQSQKPVPDNTKQSQQTGIHGTGGIRTHNPRKRAAADPRLRPHGHWDRPYTTC